MTPPDATVAPVMVVGEILVDMVPGSLLEGLPYVAHLGGAPVNVAVGLTALGVRAHLVGGLGSDPFARRIVEKLTSIGVDLTRCHRVDLPTAVADASIRSGGPSYHFTTTDTSTFVAPDVAGALGQFQAVYVGRLAAVADTTAESMLLIAHRAATDTTLVVDPNVRNSPMLHTAKSRRRLQRYCEIAHLLTVSDDDVRHLWPGQDPLDVGWNLARQGKAVVLTRGADGIVGFTARGNRVEVPAAPVTVVDTIAAGDAFTAALIANLAHRGALTRENIWDLAPDTLKNALAASVESAARPCTHAGTNPARLARYWG